MWKQNAAKHATTAEAGDSQNIAQDTDLWTLHKSLYFAAEGGHAPVVKLLCQYVDVSQPCLLGCSFTESAAIGGHADVVETLLHHGANPNTKTEKGFTAWDLADSKIIMDILERWGTDITMPDRDWWDDYIDGRDDNAGEMTMLER